MSETPGTVLVTGASSGIGRALALEYAASGARIALAARRADMLEDVAREVRGRGATAITIPVDVSQPDAVREAVARADRDLGGLDMVIANAGIGGNRHATTLDWSYVDRMIDVNLKGAIATLLAAVPIMLAHGKGHLVAVTSIAGRRALPQAATYSATKAALSTFLEGLRLDLAKARIHVTDVQPGFVESELTAKNTYKMPFLWPADRAARHIVKRLQNAPAVIAFPWPVSFLSAMTRLLPVWAYDPMVRLSADRVGVR